jgi:hypothetical protein
MTMQQPMPAGPRPGRASYFLRATALVLGLLAATTARATEQEPADPDLSTEGMRRMGPFHVQPSVVLRNLGYDDNVRLEAAERSGDTTATFGPHLDLVLLTGNRGGFHLSEQLDYVTFARNTDLNHWNDETRSRGILLLKKVALSLEDRFTSRRERPNTEIDSRLRQNDHALTLGGRSLGQGRLGVETFVRGERIRYSSDDPEDDIAGRTLDRDERSLSVLGTVKVWRKTSVLLEGTAERAEFTDRTQGRDTRGVSVLAGLRFDPSAAIQGEFRVGTMSLAAPDRPGNDFRGPIGAGSLRTRLGRRARVTGRFGRDLVYSTLRENLYFVSTGWTAGYEEFFSRRVSGEVAYGRTLNHYPQETTRLGAPSFQGIRDDTIRTYEAVVHVHLGEQLVAALRAYRINRDSTDDFYDRERTVYSFDTTYNF